MATWLRWMRDTLGEAGYDLSESDERHRLARVLRVVGEQIVRDDRREARRAQLPIILFTAAAAAFFAAMFGGLGWLTRFLPASWHIGPGGTP